MRISTIILSLVFFISSCVTYASRDRYLQPRISDTPELESLSISYSALDVHQKNSTGSCSDQLAMAAKEEIEAMNYFQIVTINNGTEMPGDFHIRFEDTYQQVNMPLWVMNYVFYYLTITTVPLRSKFEVSMKAHLYYKGKYIQTYSRNQDSIQRLSAWYLLPFVAFTSFEDSAITLARLHAKDVIARIQREDFKSQTNR